MRPDLIRIATFASAVALIFLLTGCGPKSPEQQVADTRAQYVVQLNTWAPREPVVEEVAEEPAAEDAAEGDTGTESTVEEAAGGDQGSDDQGSDDQEMAMEIAGPRPMTIFFDLIVRFDGDEALPGITVDVTHADPFEQEKGAYRQWIDTAGMAKRDTRQISFVLEGIEFEDGDTFSVLLRAHVPLEERGDYREFVEAGSS